MSQTIDSSVEQADAATDAPASDELVLEEDSLVEEVSIDGMCGVY